MLPQLRCIGTDKGKRYLFTICLFFSVTAHATVIESSSGTIVVLGYSKQKVVIAADSRRHYVTGGRNTDEECKIVALDDYTVFTSTGTIGGDFKPHPPYAGIRFKWNAADEAREALLDAGGISSDLRRVAEAWGLRMTERFEKELSIERNWTLGQLDNDIFTVGVFIEFSKAISIDQATVFYDRTDGHVKANVGVVEVSDTIQFAGLGKGTAFITELVAGDTPFSKRASAKWGVLSKQIKVSERDARKVIWWAELAVTHLKDPMVGGRIDAAELFPGKQIRWLQRKKKCQNEK